MPEALLTHIRKFTTLTEEEGAAILSRVKTITLKKKQNILEEGSKCNAIYFVVSGCLRMYYLKEKGVEQTISFGLENWWLTDLIAFQQQKTSTYAVQAVEASTIIAIEFNELEQMLEAIPALERYFRKVYQRAASAAQLRIRYLYDMSREELYLQFAALFPEFIQRVPQYMLASYLGFTPEYLSEIRRKYASRRIDH